MTTTPTWDVRLWCNLCGKVVGQVKDVIAYGRPEPASVTLQHVREEMRGHERREHAAPSSVGSAPPAAVEGTPQGASNPESALGRFALNLPPELP